MLIGSGNFHQHKPWIVATIVVAVLAVIWFLAASQWDRYPPWPSGGTWPGLIFGIVGGGICFFEFLLWPRKRFRAWRIGRVQGWMRAHIWLGLLAVPILMLHSGFRFSNLLALVTLILFGVVITSGIWGAVMQMFLPTRMLNEVPGETIASQIPAISAQLAHEAERLVESVCGDGVADAADNEPDEARDFVVVGKVRVQGGTQGRVLQTVAVTGPLENCGFLRKAFNDTIRPYLEKGDEQDSPLAAPLRAATVFSEVRVRIPPAAHGTLEAIEGLVEQRRQLDRQLRLNYWLHNWLWVHLPLSVALMVLMFVHTFVALRYLYTR